MNHLSSAEQEERGWIRKAIAKNPPVIEDPASIWSAYHIEQGWRKRYYYTDERKTQLAITATHDALKAKCQDAKTVSSMLDLAQARGWKTVYARGSMDFRREAWIQAHVKGNIAVTGYWETSADWRDVARRQSQAQESRQSVSDQTGTANPAIRNPEVADLVKRIDRVVRSAERASTPATAGNDKPASRASEQERWDRVGKVGGHAVASDRVRATEKQTATERQRPQTA